MRIGCHYLIDFSLQLIKKHQTRVTSMDEQIIALYSKGMTNREIVQFRMTEIKNRGVEEILIACIDGLKGFPDAISSVFPQTDIQLCIVHMVRNSLRFVSWKDYKAVTKGLKEIYQATTEENALIALDLFEKHWINQYPKIAESWRNHYKMLHKNGQCQSEIGDWQ